MSFGFVRHTFVTNDRIEHVKINYFILFLTGKLKFHFKIDTNRTKASFFKR